METTVFDSLGMVYRGYVLLVAFSGLCGTVAVFVSCVVDVSCLRFWEWRIFHKKKSEHDISEAVRISVEYEIFKCNITTAKKYYKESLDKCRRAQSKLEEKGKLKIRDTELSAEIKRLRILREKLESIEYHVRVMEPVIASNLKYDKYYQDVMLEETYKEK